MATRSNKKIRQKGCLKAIIWAVIAFFCAIESGVLIDISNYKKELANPTPDVAVKDIYAEIAEDKTVFITIGVFIILLIIWLVFIYRKTSRSNSETVAAEEKQELGKEKQGLREEKQEQKKEKKVSKKQYEDPLKQFFIDVLYASERLLEFGQNLSKDQKFCDLLGETISGDITMDGKLLTDPADKIKMYLCADVLHSYTCLGHRIDLNTREGLGLMIFGLKILGIGKSLEYKNLDIYRQSALDPLQKMFREMLDSTKDNPDIFVLEVCLKNYDKQLHKQYVVLLYRFASLIAKADKTVSETEAKNLNKIMQHSFDAGAAKKTAPAEQPGAKDEYPTGRGLLAMKQLDSLIGLSSVKAEVASLANYISVRKMRQAKGMKVSPVSYHCVFTGNPGTGKTTVARIISNIYKELGILSKGHLVETDRSGLVAEYVGQTAVKTNKIIDSALDGILFIDEAYSLVDGGNSDYGKEAISTLLKRMEDDRDRLVVILAGYTDDMKRFIDSNPGLQSRFNRYIEFPDYSADELFNIFLYSVNKYEYTLTDDALTVLKEALAKAVESKDKNFGNGRYVRNLFEKVVEHQANRLSAQADVSSKSLASIEAEDIKSSL